jgi:putative ABC transport system substrate-binding protein
LQGSLVLGSLGLLSACGQLPFQAPAPAQIPRIGLLSPSSPDFSRNLEEGPFRQRLHELGYVEGQHLAIEARYAEGRNERLPDLLATLIDPPVDVLVVGGPSAVRAAKQATGAVPTVMVGGSRDPVEAGYVASLARPGGNITGLTTAPSELTDAKRLELLKQSLPGLSRVAVLRDANGVSRSSQPQLEHGARTLGVQLELLDVRGPEELGAALGIAATAGAEALLVTADEMLVANGRRIAELAVGSGLPAISTFTEFATHGGLMAYGVNLPDLWKRAAYYVDRILKGAKPADLPIEQPTTFDLVINLQTARALGLTIPQDVLLQATEIIQ